MRIGKYLCCGILVFISGLITVLMLGGTLGSTGDGTINSSIFNSAMMALVGSILFLSTVIVICTLIIVNTIKDKQ